MQIIVLKGFWEGQLGAEDKYVYVYQSCNHASCFCFDLYLYAFYSVARMKYLHLSELGSTVYPKKYAHGFCFAVLCCGYTLTDFPISIRLTLLALWQSNDCPSASKATLMNMDKYFMWIHYERLHNHNKAKHNKTVCIFLGIYCMGTQGNKEFYQWSSCIVNKVTGIFYKELWAMPALHLWNG